MFALSKAQRDRRRYVRSVRKLVSEVFGLSELEVKGHNRLWGDWLNLKRQECRDLHALLTANVSDAFKARAISILLAPRIKLAPFAWRDETSLNDYLSLRYKIEIANLSSRLQEFVLELLEINLDVALAPDADDDLRRTLFYYNRFILEALALLADSPKAEQLFNRYQINDPIPFMNMEDASGYTPLYEILVAVLPEKWKRRADARMRGVIEAEQEGSAEPRRDWEKALPNYVNHIQLCLYQQPFPYSSTLLASQIRFVLNLPNTDGTKLFDSWQVGKFLQVLGMEDAELSHKFARHIVLADHGENGAYAVYNAEGLANAQAMFDEFAGKDAELGHRLKTIIAEGETRVRENQASVQARQSKTEAVLAQMQ